MWGLAEEVMFWKGDVGGLEKQLLKLMKVSCKQTN